MRFVLVAVDFLTVATLGELMGGAEGTTGIFLVIYKIFYFYLGGKMLPLGYFFLEGKTPGFDPGVSSLFYADTIKTLSTVGTAGSDYGGSLFHLVLRFC